MKKSKQTRRKKNTRKIFNKRIKHKKRSKRRKRGGASPSLLLARYGAGGDYPHAPSYSIEECRQKQAGAEARRLEAVGMASQPRSAYASHGWRSLIDQESGNMYYISPEGKRTWVNPGAQVPRIEESELEQERRWTREEAAAAKERHQLWKATKISAAKGQGRELGRQQDRAERLRQAKLAHHRLRDSLCVQGSSVAMPTSRRPPTGKEPILLNRKRKRPYK